MDELRKSAEEILKKKNGSDSDLSNLELQKLIEELNIHQIELEIQNQELRENRLELEASREKYFNLFEKAPIGYIILNKNGVIEELNLKAVDILNLRKDYVYTKPFVALLTANSISVFYEYFDSILHNQNALPVELSILIEFSVLFINSS